MPDWKKKMKIIAILACLLLASCASRPSRQFLDYQAYIQHQKPKAQAGDIKWSDYYKGLYDKAAAAGAPGWRLTGFNQASGMAMRYEAGEITKDQFDYEIRALKAADASAGEAAMAQERVEADRRAQLGASQMAAGAALIQASQPRPILPLPNTPTPTGIYGGLQSQSINGQLKYCRYSNGVVTTISSWAICPVSNP
jgi:hypothetical protein